MLDFEKYTKEMWERFAQSANDSDGYILIADLADYDLRQFTHVPSKTLTLNPQSNLNSNFPVKTEQ